MGQKFAAYDTQGKIIGFYDSVDSPVPEGVLSIEISDDEWQACLDTGLCTVVGEALILATEQQIAGRDAERRMAEVSTQRDSLMSMASGRIAPLQDAFDLGEATAEESAQLTAWKKYRVALNRLDLTVEPVLWPAQPA